MKQEVKQFIEDRENMEHKILTKQLVSIGTEDRGKMFGVKRLDYSPHILHKIYYSTSSVYSWEMSLTVKLTNINTGKVSKHAKLVDSFEQFKQVMTLLSERDYEGYIVEFTIDNLEAFFPWMDDVFNIFDIQETCERCDDREFDELTESFDYYFYEFCSEFKEVLETMNEESDVKFIIKDYNVEPDQDIINRVEPRRVEQIKEFMTIVYTRFRQKFIESI